MSLPAELLEPDLLRVLEYQRRIVSCTNEQIFTHGDNYPKALAIQSARLILSMLSHIAEERARCQP